MHRAPTANSRQAGLFPVFTGTGFVKMGDACPTVNREDIYVNNIKMPEGDQRIREGI